MEQNILIRLGEIFLKGNNKNFFLKMLKTNIIEALSGLEYHLSTTQNRMYIESYDTCDEDEIISRLKCVFGIFSISPAIKIKTDIDSLCASCVEYFPTKGKFRVTVNRADKRVPMNSMELSRHIGGYMLEKSKELTVDLFNHDFEANIDIRENGYSYLFYEKIMGQGGLPVGCSGNGMLLLSGGIDSPVAGYMMAKRGVKTYAIHYHSYPYTSEQAKEKVIDLAKIISRYCGEIELIVVPFTDIQYAIKENCPIEYMITIMRRFMMKIAEKFALKYNCYSIITGESLAQVASQTMESINVTNSVVSLPVFRPLIGLDKTEIITISEKIGAFKTSILPFEDCCTVFLPKNPVIKPKLDLAIDYENRTDMENLINNAFDNAEIITCKYDN